MKTAAMAAIYQDDDRMTEIIFKASQIFYHKGFDGTSMNDIAEAMDMTKAGIYHYVESKEDLLFKIMSDAMDWMDREVVEPAKGISDPAERLTWIIRRHAREMIEGASSISIVSEELLALGPKRRQQIQERRQIYHNFVKNTVLAMKAEGKLRDVDPTVAVFSLFGMLLWLPRWYQRDGSLTTSQAIDNVISLYFGGILK